VTYRDVTYYMVGLVIGALMYSGATWHRLVALAIVGLICFGWVYFRRRAKS